MGRCEQNFSMPIHYIFETNPNGSEKYSGAKTIDAVSARKAADLYQDEFKPVAHASHLMVTTEGGTQELIALRGVSLPPLHEARPAFAAEPREAPPAFAAETREAPPPSQPRPVRPPTRLPRRRVGGRASAHSLDL